MQKIVLCILFSILGCATQMDQQLMFSRMTGLYKITQAGCEFIIRDMKNIVSQQVTLDDKLEIKDLKIYLNNTTDPILLGTFLEIREEKAIFQLASNNKYIMATIHNSNLLIATTNSKAVVDEVFDEITVPIGVKENS